MCYKKYTINPARQNEKKITCEPSHTEGKAILYSIQQTAIWLFYFKKIQGCENAA